MFSFVLNEYGLIRVSGDNAAKFLQGQLTCDVREVNAQQSRLGAHCDAKGRIQVCFRLYQFQNNYYLRVLKSLIPHTLTLLQKYAVFSKVTLEDVSAEWSLLGLSMINPLEFIYSKQLDFRLGVKPRATGAYGLYVRIASGADNNAENSSAQSISALQVDGTLQTENKIFIRVAGLTPRYEIIGSPNNNDNFQKQLPASFKLSNFSQWQLDDIRAGIANIFPATCGLFTPHDINYPQVNGVSFNKGCYTGQEIIARMHFLGKLKQHMYRVQFMNTTTPAPGASLIDEQGNSIGTLMESAQTENQSWEALAVLQDKALAQPILLENSEKTVLRVLDLPYTT